MFDHCKILRNVKKYSLETPDKLAFIAGVQTITYRELWQEVRGAAQFLQNEGVRQGDRVVLSAQKDLKFASFYLALHALGAIAVLVDPNWTTQKLNYVLQLVSPRFIVGLTQENKSVKTFSFSIFEPSSDADSVVFPGKSAILPDDIADIMFTTGTTGAPKGVLLSYEHIVGAVENGISFIQNTTDDVEAIGLPFCHSFGLNRLRSVLMFGGTAILLESFANVKQFFEAIERYGVTGFAMVPSVWAYIRKFSGTRIAKYGDQIRFIETGSTPMPIESKKELCDIFPNTRICMFYGLTEASRCLFTEFHTDFTRLDSIGKPVSCYVEAKIFDEHGAEVASGETGELCLRGNMMMKSYFLDSENQNAYFDDYFRTGDLGRCDSDGYFYLVGRKKELINVGGNKVSPLEVENAICSLNFGIQDCACVGIEDPNGLMGEVVKAYLLRTANAENVNFDKLSQSLTNLLEPYQIPAVYEWIDEIPQTTSGKKQRLLLKDGDN